jgi:hypothetical protein
VINTRLRAIYVATVVMIGSAMTAPAVGQTVPESEDGRFTFYRAEGGYLRLDGRSGQVSLCARRTASWLCQAVPDDRTAYENEIARLQGDNAILKKELLKRNLALPGGGPPEVGNPIGPRQSDSRQPNEGEFNRAMNFFEMLWRRLVETIANIQRDLARRT